jgi:hypothetical protein
MPEKEKPSEKSNPPAPPPIEAPSSFVAAKSEVDELTARIEAGIAAMDSRSPNADLIAALSELLLRMFKR